MSLVMADVNGLKAANDRNQSHAEGDAALKAVASALSRATGRAPGSVAGRIGGDEFCAVVEGGLRVAEALAQEFLRLASDAPYIRGVAVGRRQHRARPRKPSDVSSCSPGPTRRSTSPRRPGRSGPSSPAATRRASRTSGVAGEARRGRTCCRGPSTSSARQARCPPRSGCRRWPPCSRRSGGRAGGWSRRCATTSPSRWPGRTDQTVTGHAFPAPASQDWVRRAGVHGVELLVRRRRRPARRRPWRHEGRRGRRRGMAARAARHGLDHAARGAAVRAGPRRSRRPRVAGAAPGGQTGARRPALSSSSSSKRGNT